MDLPSFEPEILSQILNDIPATWLVNLWLTGSRPLHYAMSSRGGVTSIILQTIQSAYSPSRLPGMVSSLTRLTSLTISSPDRVADPWRLWMCLTSLQELQYLKLCLPDAEECLFHPLNESGDVSSLFDDECLAFQSSEPRLRDLKTAFPNLQTLIVESYGTTLLVDEDLASFPQSLTRLELPVSTNLTFNCLCSLASLPRIASLTLQITKTPPKPKLEGFVLPKTITRLKLCNRVLPRLEFPASFWNGCSITNLSIPRILASSCIPETIEEMITEDIDFPIARYPSLKRLTISRASTSIGKECHLLALAESKLETLIMPKLIWNLPGFCKFIPTSLTHLELKVRSYPSPPLQETMDAIGECKGLIYLLIELPADLLPSHFANLPASLKTLIWWFVHFKGVARSELAASLPKGLTTLEISSSDNGLYFHPSALGFLPMNLTSLKCGISFEEGIEDFTGFPKALRVLELHCSNNLYSASFGVPADIFKACAMLPLQTLKIMSLNPIEYSLKTLRLLPQDLYRLHIASGLTLRGSFAALPSGLRYLDIGSHSTSSIRGAELKDLPRNLASLRWHGFALLADESLGLLPPNLTFLSLSYR